MGSGPFIFKADLSSHRIIPYEERTCRKSHTAGGARDFRGFLVAGFSEMVPRPIALDTLIEQPIHRGM